MRLTEQERQAITTLARQIFGEDVEVRLFGSRVDDSTRGGDIDLHLDVNQDVYGLKNEIRFELELQKVLGERKIDVVTHRRGADPRPIDQLALEQGLEL